MASDSVPSGNKQPTNHSTTSAGQVFRRVLVPVLDASQAAHAAELAIHAGATEARVLHLRLHEAINGRRYPIETESDASYVVEAGVFELRMAGIAASGQVREALVSNAAQEIAADAAAWGADLIILGVPRRTGFASRLFGSLTLRVLKHAPCAVLVASPASIAHTTHISEKHLASTPS
ncbi:MAG: universal stress protein [Nocardiopsaceae bacterium]|jgi:nucleotide-binding universal stress UspA family protein|nr:universal stress protein [Nocardiopsaceae bacterium]